MVVSLWDGKLRIAFAPVLSSCWGAVVVGWPPQGEPDELRDLVVSPFFKPEQMEGVGEHRYNGMSSSEPFGFQGVKDVPCVLICAVLSPWCRKCCGKPGRFYVTLRLHSVSPAACGKGISLWVGKQIFKVGI